jgi:hypothetical protein
MRARGTLVRTVIITIAFVMIAMVVAVLGWGYWHVSSHADVHVSLWDVALKTDRQLYGSLLAADVVFRDEKGRMLARARADKPWGIVSKASTPARSRKCQLYWTNPETHGGSGGFQCRTSIIRRAPISN